MLKRQVGGIGPLDASIMLIGEALGTTEVQKGEPFIGWSGQFLREMCERAGLTWTSMRVDNVVQHQPERNDFSVFYSNKQPTGELLAWWVDLRARILEVRPKVIIAAGDRALEALTGNRNSTQWRGSVIPYESQDFRCWIVPIVHPSYSRRCFNMTSSKRKEVRQPWFYITVYDLIKARKVSEKGWEPLQRTEKIFPTYVEVMEYLEELNALPSDAMITIDIETIRRTYVKCLGLTHRCDFAMCIPFVANNAGHSFYSLHQEAEIWKVLDNVLNTHLVCGQTIAFDCAYLWRDIGLVFTDEIFVDTAILHSLLYPELKHDLGFLVSIYTDMPYFKYLGRQAEAKANIAQTFEYNCFDVESTHEVAERLIVEAKNEGLWEYYLNKRLPLAKWAIRQHTHGLSLDGDRQKEIYKSIHDDEIVPMESALQEALQESGYGEVNVRSPQQVVALLRSLGYDIISSQEEILSGISEESIVAKTILQLRSLYSLLTTIERPPDEDGRFRTSLNLHVTETTRLSSTRSHFGGGTNLQNISPKARPLFCGSEEL